MRKLLHPRSLFIALVVVILAVSIPRLTASDNSAEGRSSQALTKARELLVAIDHAELCHWQRHGRYGNLPDLDETMEALSPSHLAGSLMSAASAEHLDLEMQISRSGKSDLQRITGRKVDTFVERRGADFVDYGPDGWRRLPTRCNRPTR